MVKKLNPVNLHINTCTKNETPLGLHPFLFNELFMLNDDLFMMYSSLRPPNSIKHWVIMFDGSQINGLWIT